MSTETKRRKPVPENIGTLSVSRRRDLIRGALVFFLTLCWCAFFSRFGVDFHHDGVVLIPALRITEGEALFRDAFCQYGWLLPVLQGAILKMFGTELFFLKLLNALFYALAALALDQIWKRFLSAKTNWIPVFLFLLLLPDTMVTTHAWSSVPALWAFLTALYFLLCFWEKSRHRYLFLSGLFTGLTLLFRHPCGAAAAAATLFLLAADSFFSLPGRRKNSFFSHFLLWLSAFSLALFPAILVITLTGAWHDFFRQCFSFVFIFVQHRGGEWSWGYLGDCFFPFLSSELWFCNSIFALLPLTAIFFLLAIIFVINGENKETKAALFTKKLPLLSLILFSLASWHQYYPVPCVRHLFWGGVPMFGFLPLLLERSWEKSSRWSALCRAASLLLILSACLCLPPRLLGIWIRIATVNSWYNSDAPGLRGLLLTTGEFRCIRDFRRQVESLPPAIRARGIYNDTENSLWTILLLPECRLPHPQFYRIKDTPYPDYADEVSRYLAEKKPVLFTDEPGRHPGWEIAFHGIYMKHPYFLMIPARQLLYGR